MKLFFPIFAIICFIFYSKLRHSSNAQASQTESFWTKESQANQTRKKDIEHLDYITIPFEKLPFLDNPSKIIASYEKTMLSLKERRIINLSGISNTELKLTYGAANLPALSSYDENYTRMVTTFTRWGKALRDEGFIDEAQTLWETAIDIGCDSGQIFLDLNSLYKSKGIDRTDYLITKLNECNTPMKNSILNKLQG